MRTHALVAVTLAVLVLSGCSPDDPTVVPQPEPTTTPLFASDEEALAAAEEAYGAYLAVIDSIYADGGSNPERVEVVATAEVAESEKAAFAEAAAAGQRSIGETSFDSMTIQSADYSGATDVDVVSVYVCEDFSGTDVLNAEGVSVVSPGRQTRWPLTLTFSFDAETDRLILSDISDWTGLDFCA